MSSIPLICLKKAKLDEFHKEIATGNPDQWLTEADRLLEEAREDANRMNDEARRYITVV